MPRKKKPKAKYEKTCVVCAGNFECSRDDKETCGVTCRKRLSRANGEMYRAREHSTANSHKAQTRTTSASPERGGSRPSGRTARS